MNDLLRTLAPQVLGALTRRHGGGRFDACEDAVQEALLAASQQWPAEGVPANPTGWLLTVANRRLVDRLRSDSARQRREDAVAHEPDLAGDVSDRDDSLTLLFLCCHPSLSPASQLALTLRAVAGLTTAEIAAAFFVPEATMAQRISRAKQTIKAAGEPFHLPPEDERADRLRVVLHVVSLLVTEDRTAPEALRLARMLHAALPDDEEVAGLLALVLLTCSRSAARTDELGALVPLAEQDRTRWDHGQITEAVALLEATLPRGRIGRYQLQAAIAAVHAEAPTDAATDWPQILGLYDLLARVDPSPVVTLNRAVALSKVVGPGPALDVVDGLAADKAVGGTHRWHAVRAHLLEEAGDLDGARDHFRLAARKATSLAEQRHLERRARA